MMKGKPISPEDVGLMKTATFPPEVFDSFNELIAANYVGGHAKVFQWKVKDLIKSKLESWEQDWLNVEDAYRNNGWKVVYEKPAYNEMFDAYFTFTAKK